MSRCDLCTRPTHDTATICTHCGITTPATHLQSLNTHMEAALNKSLGTARTGTGTRPTGKPGSRLPLDLAATQRIDTVNALLASWVRRIRWERTGNTTPTHGLHPQALAYLAANLEWMRHRLDAPHLYTDIAASERVIRQLANGRPERHYLGPCSNIVNMANCPGDIYANRGAINGTCNTCRASVRTADRRAWLDDLVRDYAFTAADIAGAYPIPRNTINQWHHRGRLTPHHWDHNGDPCFTLGDVLDLAAESAARRAETQARKART